MYGIAVLNSCSHALILFWWICLWRIKQNELVWDCCPVYSFFQSFTGWFVLCMCIVDVSVCFLIIIERSVRS